MRALLPPGMENRLAHDGGASFARTLEPTTRVRVNATITLKPPSRALRIQSVHICWCKMEVWLGQKFNPGYPPCS